MNQKELSELTDQELLAEAKKNKSTKIMDATLIGFLIGMVAYSVFSKSFGFLMIIPLLLAFKIFNKPKNDETLETMLKERNLQ